MKMTLRRVLIPALALALCSISGCSDDDGGSSGGDPCSGAGQCKNDPKATQANIDACKAAVADATCGAKYKAMVNCLSSKRKCTAAGVTDTQAGMKACSTEVSAYNACKAGGGDGGGGGDTSAVNKDLATGSDTTSGGD